MTMKTRVWSGRAIGFVLGFALWCLSPVLTGHEELWDGAVLLYVGSTFVIGLASNMISRECAWKTALWTYLGQVTFMLLFLPKGPLTPVGMIFGLAYTLPAWVGALLVKPAARKRAGGGFPTSFLN